MLVWVTKVDNQELYYVLLKLLQDATTHASTKITLFVTIAVIFAQQACHHSVVGLVMLKINTLVPTVFFAQFNEDVAAHNRALLH